jgi:Family of unknown function (DUF5522)
MSSMPPVRPNHVDEPHPARLAPTHPRCAEILERHAAAVAAGRPGYADPTTGFTVFTAVFLAARGYCCTSGCRHCPFVGATAGPEL